MFFGDHCVSHGIFGLSGTRVPGSPERDSPDVDDDDDDDDDGGINKPILIAIIAVIGGGLFVAFVVVLLKKTYNWCTRQNPNPANVASLQAHYSPSAPPPPSVSRSNPAFVVDNDHIAPPPINPRYR